ncbi:MAG: DJ-1/PfpI family protein [Segniliparus sp.]|uniref:DJ-1/PfpI family protein n=1 Tax=Segniliparus sp. TaxID=2804064 RepID=UPI003F2BFA0E
MLMYPGFTALDFVAPQLVFSYLEGAQVHHVAATAEPVVSDTGLVITPTTTMEDCPRDVDVLFIPGARDPVVAAMRDEHLVGFVADLGSRASWVTSVCTGSMVLGMAGLLEGYSATSHWSVRHLLAKAGAIPVNSRVVIDGNRATGGGVTSGLDFALALVSVMRDRTHAEQTQLVIEYAPNPPFNAGTPESAPPSITARTRAASAEFVADVAAAFDTRR